MLQPMASTTPTMHVTTFLPSLDTSLDRSPTVLLRNKGSMAPDLFANGRTFFGMDAKAARIDDRTKGIDIAQKDLQESCKKSG